MNQQMVFYHLGYEIFENFKPYTSTLQAKIQKLRAAFDSTTSEAESLKRKMLMVFWCLCLNFIILTYFLHPYHH